MEDANGFDNSFLTESYDPNQGMNMDVDDLISNSDKSDATDGVGTQTSSPETPSESDSSSSSSEEEPAPKKRRSKRKKSKQQKVDLGYLR